ncbi:MULTISPECIES: tetratricopeptide repeat protein [Flavobacterium]|uniref:Tetratricopeptide repeat protein n=1 Tax=Flavobacterium jumunjinense TaxID=998845 RepID=A0ABV5GJL9_9FLAO|nr:MULTISPECIES: tetratricopeptide repeat protein [Flavobacterium]
MKLSKKNAYLYLLFLFSLSLKTNNLYAQKKIEFKVDSIIDVAREKLIFNVELLHKATKLAKKYDYGKGYARGLLNIGAYYSNTGRIDSSTIYLDSCEKFVQTKPDLEFILSYVYNHKAIILTNQEFFSKALQQYNLVYKLNLKYKNPSVALDAKINMISCYLKLEGGKKALEMVNQIKKDSLLINSEKNKVPIYKLNSITALSYYHLEQYDKALEYWNENLKIIQSKNNNHENGYIYTSIAGCYLKKGDYKKALENAHHSEKILLSENDDNESKIGINKLLGIIYHELDNPTKSNSYLERVVNSNNHNTKSKEVAYKYISLNYEKLEQWKEATETNTKYRKLIDSVNKTREKEAALFHYNDFNFIEEKHKNKLLKQENTRQYLIIGVIIIVFGLISIYVYYRYFKKKIESERIVEDASKNKPLEINEREVLTNHIKQREEELLGTAVTISTQMEKISKIKSELSTAIESEDKSRLNQVNKSVNEFIESYSNLTTMFNRIESQYPEITSVLKEKYPQLSTNDIRHCLLLKLDLSIKECAQLLNVSTHAVKMARKRIKNKMDLAEDESLKKHIN